MSPPHTAPSAVTESRHPNHSTLDGNILRQLESLGDDSGQDLVDELATMFVADADAQLTEMHRALDVADAVAVARSAHNLSGASATLGATDLASLCKTLESQSAEGNLSNGEPLLEAVETELVLVHSAFALRKTQADRVRISNQRRAESTVNA
jgi:HPt (histidine-containing phosphotransfer) domain-containing protein